LLGADNQRSNLQVVAGILEAMGKPADFFEFVLDRPGHDLRYAIDASATIQELGWAPKLNAFEEKLGDVIDFYVAQKVEVSKISGSGLSTSY
jgi:dTDP-glucose 4,6-dehydratase